MATHSSVLAWRIPGMAEPGGLPSMGPHRVGHEEKRRRGTVSVSAPVAESAGVAGKEDEREMGRRRQEVSPRPALVLEVPLATPSPQIQETSKRAGSWSRRSTSILFKPPLPLGKGLGASLAFQRPPFLFHLVCKESSGGNPKVRRSTKSEMLGPK